MQYAKSMRYGGVFVEAHKCDRESYLKLGLLCPVCNAPVFYVSGKQIPDHERKVKDKIIPVKGSKVDAFFSHFEADKYSEMCKAKEKPSIAAPTRKDVVDAKNNLQKQSLKLFNAHFFDILKTSPYMVSYEQDVMFYVEGLCRESDKSREATLSILKGIETGFGLYFRQNLSKTKELLDAGIAYTGIELLLEQELNHQVALEALNFLATSPAKKILSNLFKKACAEEIQQTANYYDELKKDNPDITYDEIRVKISDPDGILDYMHNNWENSSYSTALKSKFHHKSERWSSSYVFAINYILVILLSINWGKMFDKYEKWQKEYRDKLSFLEMVKPEEKVELSMYKRALGLHHHTLVTGHILYQPISRVDDNARDILMKRIGEIKPGKSKIIKVPVAEDYEVKISRKETLITFEIYKGYVPNIFTLDNSEFIIGGILCWNEYVNFNEITFEDTSTYMLVKTQQHKLEKLISDKKIPLLSVASVNPRLGAIRWLASFEYCLGLTLLQMF